MCFLVLGAEDMSSSWIDLLNLPRPLKATAFTVDFDTDRYNAKAMSGDLHKELDETWERVLNEAKPGRILFNQSKFRLHSVEHESRGDQGSTTPVLNLGLTDYKSFICTQQQILAPDLRQQITSEHLAHPLGVGCLLITSDQFAVLIRRSAACIDLPNMYDIPGGHAEPK